MTTTSNDPYGFLANLSLTQRDLYNAVNRAAGASGEQFWEILRRADAPAEDKWQLCEAMGYSGMADNEWAVAAGRDPDRRRVVEMEPALISPLNAADDSDSDGM